MKYLGIHDILLKSLQECRKLRNFSSLVAIASALHSAPIERTPIDQIRTDAANAGKLEALGDIINPTANHRGYRNAVSDAPTPEERDRCIPWLGELH